MISQWLRSQAGEAIRAELEEKLQEQTDAKESRCEKATVVEIGCVFPGSAESGCFYDKLSNIETTIGNGLKYHLGTLGKIGIVISEGGKGPEKAALATETVLDVFRPKRLLGAGFASALDPELLTNTILVPDRIIDESGEEWSLYPRKQSEITLLSVEGTVGSPLKKSELYAKFGTKILDRELFAIATVAKNRNVPFLPLKIVLDTAEEEIPLEVRHINIQSGGAARKMGALFGAIFNRPSSALDMMKMQERSLIASEKLAIEICKIIKSGETN